VRLLALIVGVLLVGGCSTPSTDGPVSSAGATASSAPAPATPDPWSITIPKIESHSTLIPLGLTEKAELEVPPIDQPMQAGWYAGADPAFDGDEIKPGDTGPAVIAGHVDGIGPDGRKGSPGIFARLSELAPGDEVLIDRADASRLRFVVTAVQRHAKEQFPSQQVYGPTTQPELRLITCGGAFDRGAGHYVDNWVVWAVLA
jgi:sortase (surface protein transpeptidase)